MKDKRFIRKTNVNGDIDKIVVVTHIDNKWVEVKDEEWKTRTLIPRKKFSEYFEEARDDHKNHAAR